MANSQPVCTRKALDAADDELLPCDITFLPFYTSDCDNCRYFKVGEDDADPS